MPELLPASSGERRHWIGLQAPGAAVPDGDGGYTSGWADLDPAHTYAAIAPATVRDLERIAAGTVIAQATYVVRMPYHPQLTIESRITFGARVFSIVGIANPEERNRELILTCTEILS